MSGRAVDTCEAHGPKGKGSHAGGFSLLIYVQHGIGGGDVYRQQRNYENLNKAIYTGEGYFDIPVLEPVRARADNWISFNFAKTCDEPEIHGVHFFLDDYQFNRVWTQPDTYVNMLRRFQAVMTPDFSTYTDFPKIIQIYNHYRKHWLGAYWQERGVTVIPTISWSDPSSYEWCFDGEPVGGTVAVSSVGTQADPETAALFLQGYRAMLERLQPAEIILYGTVPAGCEGNIIPITPYQRRLKQIPTPTGAPRSGPAPAGVALKATGLHSSGAKEHS